MKPWKDYDTLKTLLFSQGAVAILPETRPLPAYYPPPTPKGTQALRNKYYSVITCCFCVDELINVLLSLTAGRHRKVCMTSKL